jgi:hypothetical protein
VHCARKGGLFFTDLLCDHIRAEPDRSAAYHHAAGPDLITGLLHDDVVFSGVRLSVDGVLPTKFPSTSMSQFGTLASIVNPGGAALAMATPVEFVGANCAMFSLMSPDTNAVTSVPFGIVMSLP